jgi:hypothetical protein
MDNEKQLKNIKSAISTIYPLIYLIWTIAISIFLCSIIFKEAFLLIFSLFFIFLAYELKKILKIFKLIPYAMTSNVKTNCLININVENWTEPRNYYAQIVEDNGSIWKFGFMPLDGEIQEGTFKAKLVWVDQVDWPVLIETEDGIIYPKQIPKKMNK